MAFGLRHDLSANLGSFAMLTVADVNVVLMYVNQYERKYMVSTCSV